MIFTSKSSQPSWLGNMIEPALGQPVGEQTLTAPELQAMREHWKKFRRFRRKSVILASILETGDSTMQCVALDLSLGGARVRLHETLEPQGQVTLVLAKFGRFPSQIVWQKGFEAGLQFIDSPEEVALRFGNDIPFE